MRLQPIMTALRESKLFTHLEEGELNELCRQCVERDYEPGDIVFQEGDEGDGLYIVKEGSIQISALVGQGQERKVLTRVGPGEFFGEMAVLDNEPRSATAAAVARARLYFVSREVLIRMFETCPALAVSLIREISHRLREFNHHYIQEVLQAERLALVGRFARSIVHDFKNPLNIIGLATELLNMDTASSQMRQTASERIRKQVDRLTNMINELLEFTRGPQQAVVLAASDFAQFMKGVVEELGPEVRDKGVALVFKSPPPSARVAMDQRRLLHLFANLIHNAVDAMPEGGTVYLSFESVPEGLQTEIEDTGPGIAPEILPRLFEAFATFGKAKGTGLGLSICKKIVEDHRGSIEAVCEPGRGAIFRICLPVQPG